MHPANTHIRFTPTQSDQSFLGTLQISKGPRLLKADQTAQADLSVQWGHISEGTFSHITGYLSVALITSFVYNLMNSPNIPMASSVVKICPVMIVAWWRSSVTVDIVCWFVLVRQCLTTVFTPHQVACFYAHPEKSSCFPIFSSIKFWKKAKAYRSEPFYCQTQHALSLQTV